MTKRNLTLLLAIALLAMVVDQVSKLLILQSLRYEGNQVPVLGELVKFVLTLNKQGVFGLALGRGLTYFLFPLLGILLVIVFASSARHAGFTSCYGLVLGGAFGNLIDRLFRHRGVVDFISVKFFHFRIGNTWIGMDRWYTFNVADSCLVVGIVLLLAFELFTRKPQPQPASETAPAPSEASRTLSSERRESGG
jgi:signal peptidase II